MSDCIKYGCRRLETRCVECSRLVNSSRMDAWISVDEKIPQDNQDVIAYFPNEGISIAYRWENDWHDWIGWAGKGEPITHWMPLPKPPTNNS